MVTTLVEVRADVLHTALSAVAPLMPSTVEAFRDSRPLLACVHVEATGSAVAFTATNAYSLGRYTVAVSDDSLTRTEVISEGTSRIPAENMKAVLDMLKPLAKVGPIMVTMVADGSSLTVEAMGSRVACEVDDAAQYPNMGSLIERAESTGEQSVAGFNTVELCKFGKVARVLDGKPAMRLHFVADSGLTRVTFGDDVPFVGLVQQVKL